MNGVLYHRYNGVVYIMIKCTRMWLCSNLYQAFCINVILMIVHIKGIKVKADIYISVQTSNVDNLFSIETYNENSINASLHLIDFRS